MTPAAPTTAPATAATTVTMPLDTPIGQLVLECDGDVLIGVRLPSAPPGAPRRGPARRVARPAAAHHDPRRARDGAGDVPPVLRETAAQFEQYFAGERRTFELPLELDGTAFQRAVWNELTRIPYGETITYGELARRVGRPNGPRAVGQANGRNPIPVIVPCHRVVASGGIGGYGGGLAVKRALLALEGVTA